MDSTFLSNSIFNTYLTTIGKTLNVLPVENKLQKLITGFSSVDKTDLSYGIKLENFIPVILTGKTEEEESIPFFQYPVIFYGVKGEPYIGVDLREYISSNKLNEFKDLNPTEIQLDKLFTRYDGVNMLLCLMGIMDKSFKSGFEWLPKDIVIEAYTYVYNFVLKGIITLPYGDSVDTQYGSILYYFSLFKGMRLDDIGTDKILAYMNKMSKRFQLSKKDHDILISSFIQSQVNMTDDDYCTMKGMLSVTSYTLEEDKKSLFTPAIFSNALKTLWVGHGRQTSALMCFENIPLFISMLYTSNKHTTLKDSRLSKILKDSKIDIKRLNQVLESTFSFLFK